MIVSKGDNDLWALRAIDLLNYIWLSYCVRQCWFNKPDAISFLHFWDAASLSIIFRLLGINVLSLCIQVNSLLSLSDWIWYVFGHFDVIQDVYGKWGNLGLPMACKVCSQLYLGCSCLSEIGLKMFLETWMHYRGIYISPLFYMPCCSNVLWFLMSEITLELPSFNFASDGW